MVCRVVHCKACKQPGGVGEHAPLQCCQGRGARVASRQPLWLQVDEAIEDWELWGDSREIERRKAERRRQNLPPEQRRQQLAEEWVRARGEAACAKAAADKPRQKAAGGVIKDLKLEMKQIGTLPARCQGDPSSCNRCRGACPMASLNA